ncbi:ACT domain-containing protein [Maribacter sp. 1_MG-2023]|uniref:ACT domain-containing protein n=1 Tax=Maribacter sp. 1_MG-2023 TaxID=3062677 RepID=UPI0026E19EE2|nr:ACT domain-containing protein [Maribacter sp. 1_MG-2023]MDO6471623.1 ACT domain-containing protein [Maribacter sp. 1_MG-2023]
MAGETDLSILLKSLKPSLNEGSYVFLTLKDIQQISRSAILFEFKEREGITIILEKEKADAQKLKYEFVASWITLNVHSALDAVGLTAAVSTALTKHNISCNVVAAYYHDHIFVATKDTKKAMEVLSEFSGK